MTAKYIDNKTRTLTVILLYWEEDVYVAECPEVGTASQGETIEEALANLQEATELYLEDFPTFKTSLDDGVALHFVGDRLQKIVSSCPDAQAYYLEKKKGRILENPLNTQYLGNS